MLHPACVGSPIRLVAVKTDTKTTTCFGGGWKSSDTACRTKSEIPQLAPERCQAIWPPPMMRRRPSLSGTHSCSEALQLTLKPSACAVTVVLDELPAT